MALVTISTIFQTTFLAYVFLVSKGWKIARQSLSRTDISKFTVMIGGVYLIYSAYYVSVNVPQMRNFLEFILNMLYIYLFMTGINNTKGTMNFVKAELIIAQTANVPQLIPALHLQ